MPPEFRSIVVARHARIGVVGDPATAKEAWLILHGYGMLARGILHWFRGAESSDRLLVAPEGLSRFYTELSGGKRAVGASWANREELSSELEDQYQYLEQAVNQFIPAPLPLQVHGFSQGVGTGARWCVRTSRPVARLVGWAGAVPEEVTADLLKRALPHEPLHLVVGAKDAIVPPAQVEGDAMRLRTGGLDVRVHTFDGAHRIDEAMLAEFTGPR